MATPTNPRTFQMPSHGWGMIKRIVRAYGAARNDENANVESIAKLAGIHRPVISSNNNFLRSLGILEADKPKLTALGVKFSTGIGLESAAIITEALQEIIQTTPILAQLVNMLRARGAMDIESFRAQIILAAGLHEDSAALPMIKTLIDLLEESKLIEIREDKVFLGGALVVKDNGGMQPSNNPVKTNTDTPDPGKFQPIYASGNVNQNSNPWTEQLLAKFPQFDPTWNDDVKLKWFDAFDRLMKGRGL